ncbi:primosome assembly protein PriA [Undibacterium sp. YM2]|uniref:HK97 family phage prohead protease n=1 Tax=Undibacterium sp. YM2 TaxID=2058625 RepID=UPI001331EA0D|nr:HK97 family phage prohead protease [Undibacterium sp. YM2]BBB65903.1 primosome assembly protein PriA [Undibacterium sp. YM2]
MTLEKRDFGFELKDLKEDGTFEGYGSVFGVVDSYDEVVAQGAFSATLAAGKASGKMPSLLWQHRSAEPIGVYTSMSEDNIGLKVAGQLALKTVRGAEAYELLKMKAISGLSIGFVSREDSYDRVTGIRTLKAVDLWEVSLVTFPANDAARVQGVKSIEKIESIRDAEHYLRESGMSRAEAVAFIGRIKSFSQSDSDASDMQQIVNALKRRNDLFAA